MSNTGICPFAKWEPLNWNTGAIVPTAVIFHRNAASSDDLYNWWQYLKSIDKATSTHFQINLDGFLYQYVSIFEKSYGAVAANEFAVNIEAANSLGNGSMPQFDLDRLNDKQVATLIRLLNWLGAQGIPLTFCTDGRNGIGYHEQFPQWTTTGHHCPGTATVNQLVREILPLLGDDMFTDADRATLADIKTTVHAIQASVDDIHNFAHNAKPELDVISGRTDEILKKLP